MGIRPLGLVVSGDPDTRDRWTHWLARAGLEILSCRGPTARLPCPRLDGRPCPLREIADLAVVDVGATGSGPLARACTKRRDDGATLFVDDRVIEVGSGGRIRLTQPPTEAVMTAVVEDAFRPWTRARIWLAGRRR